MSLMNLQNIYISRKLGKEGNILLYETLKPPHVSISIRTIDCIFHAKIVHGHTDQTGRIRYYFTFFDGKTELRYS